MVSGRGVPLEYYKIIISVVFNRNFHNLKITYERAKHEDCGQGIPLFGLPFADIR